MKKGLHNRVLEIMMESVELATDKLTEATKGTQPFDKEPISNDELLLEYETNGYETFSKIASEQGLEVGIAYRDKMEQLKQRRQK